MQQQFNQQQPNPRAQQPAQQPGGPVIFGPEVIFGLDTERAKDAGKTNRIEKTGAYDLRIEKARYVSNPNKGTLGLELTVEDPESNRAWLTVWYNKGPQHQNALIDQGVAMINAIMYLHGAQQLTQVQQGEDYLCPELTGAQIGAVLERVQYTDRNNQAQTRMDLRQVYSLETMHTAAEAIEGLQQPTQVKELLQLLGCAA